MATETITPTTLAGLRVQPVRQRVNTINLLVYGESGVGKTVFSGSAELVPEMRPVLLIDIEGGALSLTHTYPDVQIVRVLNWNQMQEVYNELHGGRHPYKTVILDSLTEIQKFGMYNIMSDVVATHEDRDPDIPSLREWGKNIEQTRRFVRAFRDLPINSIFTALVRHDKDARTGTVVKKPYLSGRLADEVAAFLDIVVYYYVKNVTDRESNEVVQQRLMLTSSTDTNVAKDRTGKLPVVIERPTMPEIFGAVVTNKEKTA